MFCALSYRWDIRLIRSTIVVGHEGMELQGVEFKAGVVDVLDILHGVFVHGQQSGSLEETHTQKNKSSVHYYIIYYWILSVSLFCCHLKCISVHVLFVDRHIHIKVCENSCFGL